MRKKHYTKLVGILISDKTYQKLIRVTDEAEEPISKFVREILEDRLDIIKEKGELDNGE
jgi:hypothetical protein